MNEIIVAIIGSGALSTVISLVATRHARRAEAEEAIEDGLSFLLLGEIERRGERHIDAGEISTDDYAKFNALCDVYVRLGGNGYARRIKDAVDDLPLTK